MRIGIIYFSATGITEAISNHVGSILERVGNSVALINIITPESRESQFDFLEFDACIFGFPVYGGRPPTVAEEWMRTLEGRKHCVTICPDNVIHVGDVSQLFKQFIVQAGLTEDVVAKKRSKIIF